MKIIFSVIASFLLLSACSPGKAQENITVGELSQLDFREDENTVVLDVRTAEEYAEGKIEGSKNIDVLKTDLFTSSLEKLDKSKSYYVICRSGSRSQRASEQMKKAGFNHVYNVKGGMQAWQAAKLPTEK